MHTKGKAGSLVSSFIVSEFNTTIIPSGRGIKYFSHVLFEAKKLSESTWSLNDQRLFFQARVSIASGSSERITLEEKERV